MSDHAAVIRATTPSDESSLAHLATLGSRPYVPGRGLVAEVDGVAVAAISLTTGGVAADLERAHPRTVRSLRYRRYQIMRQGGDVGSARTLLRRLVPAAQARSAA